MKSLLIFTAVVLFSFSIAHAQHSVRVAPVTSVAEAMQSIPQMTNNRIDATNFTPCVNNEVKEIFFVRAPSNYPIKKGEENSYLVSFGLKLVDCPEAYMLSAASKLESLHDLCSSKKDAVILIAIGGKTYHRESGLGLSGLMTVTENWGCSFQKEIAPEEWGEKTWFSTPYCDVYFIAEKIDD